MALFLSALYIQGGKAVDWQANQEARPLVSISDTEISGDVHALAHHLNLAGCVTVYDLDSVSQPGINHPMLQDLLGELGLGSRVAGLFGVPQSPVSALSVLPPSEAWESGVDSAYQLLDAGYYRVVVPAQTADVVFQALPASRVTVQFDIDQSSQLQALVSRLESLHPYISDVVLHVHGPLTDPNNDQTEAKSEEKLTDWLELAVREMLACLTRLQPANAPRPPTLVVASPHLTLPTILLLDRLGCVCEMSSSLYDGRVSQGALLAAMLRSDRPDGLFSTIVVDQQGVSLGLVYSSTESILEACRRRKGVYYSRRRGLWEKGQTSGCGQDLLYVDLDCDRDCLRMTVYQHGAGFCHFQRRNCFNDFDGGIPHLFRNVTARRLDAPVGSYTRRLYEDANLLKYKIIEEAHELVEAQDSKHVAAEAADLLYFTAVRCAAAGVSLADVERHLDLRTLRVRRRAGNAKAHIVAAMTATSTDSTATTSSSEGTSSS